MENKLRVGLIFSGLAGVLLYWVCAGHPETGSSAFFDGERHWMKSTLKKEYLSNAYSTDFSNMNENEKPFYWKPSLKEEFGEELEKDKILKAINNYEGAVNYSEFRKYSRNLELDKEYVDAFKK